MKYVAWPAARLVLLIFALAFARSLRADELQDIDPSSRKGRCQRPRAGQSVFSPKPQDPKGRFIKGLIWRKQNKGAESDRGFAALSRDYPSCRALQQSRVLFAAQGEYEKARQQLELSIRTHAELRDCVRNLGDVYTKLASQAYDKALQFDSSTPRQEQAVAHPRLMSSNVAPRASQRFCGSVAGAAALPRQRPRWRRPRRPSPPRSTVCPTGNPRRQSLQKGGAPRGGDGAAVLQTVSRLGERLSNQKVESYLAFYASDFKTPKGEGPSNGSGAQAAHLRPQKIDVAIESPKWSSRARTTQ